MQHSFDNPTGKEGISPLYIPNEIQIRVTASTSIIFDDGIDEFVRLCVMACKKTARENAVAFLKKYG